MGMEKYVELYFDYMKKEYLDALGGVIDKDLIQELHYKIYTNNKSRHEFELLLNTIEHSRRDQRIRDESGLKNFII
ncbi:hypothetical protein [Sporosarcina sp. YIM B06819]|uniref:hypothetical protein n=1 Tax=Sporosarcina sp. YIM B06819 TaxID=3081769 RepID=UPI00298C6143|nr:hypothetical protein [Sporosarcina sp. YIM B06819]